MAKDERMDVITLSASGFCIHHCARGLTLSSYRAKNMLIRPQKGNKIAQIMFSSFSRTIENIARRPAHLIWHTFPPIVCPWPACSPEYVCSRVSALCLCLLTWKSLKVMVRHHGPGHAHWGQVPCQTWPSFACLLISGSSVGPELMRSLPNISLFRKVTLTGHQSVGVFEFGVFACRGLCLQSLTLPKAIFVSGLKCAG